MQEINLANIDKLSKKELKLAIEGCFEHAPDASPTDRLAILQEAEFYTKELDRRSDSWVSIRDLILEIIVIGLIGWEIHMGYRQAADEATEFAQQQKIFQNLETSSQATADTLTALKTTMQAMNTGIQTDLALNYHLLVWG
jgi:hypothetical protein